LLALRGITRRFPAARVYRTALETREVHLVREGGRVIRSVQTDKLQRLFVAGQAELQSTLSQPGMPDAVEAAVRGAAAMAYARVVRRRWAVTPADVRSIHRLRVAFKKLRYTVEALQPSPGVTRATLQGMNVFQTLMGEVQDAEVMSASIRRQALRSRLEALRLLPLQQYWVEEKRRRIDAFLRRADDVYRFWQGGGAPRDGRGRSKAAG
jgi:CHAD domain-containing protein